MNRRAKTLIAVLAAVVACLGTWQLASAVAPHAKAASTPPASACVTGKGLLRLANASGTCASGTSKVALARASAAPKAITLVGKTGVSSQYQALPENSSINAQCNATDGVGAAFSFATPRAVHVDGTSYAVYQGGATGEFVFNQGMSTPIAGGSDDVNSSDDGSWDIHADPQQHATLDLHLLVTVAHTMFTIDAVAEVSEGSGQNSSVCRMSAMVETAST